MLRCQQHECKKITYSLFCCIVVLLYYITIHNMNTFVVSLYHVVWWVSNYDLWLGASLFYETQTLATIKPGPQLHWANCSCCFILLKYSTTWILVDFVGHNSLLMFFLQIQNRIDSFWHMLTYLMREFATFHARLRNEPWLFSGFFASMLRMSWENMDRLIRLMYNGGNRSNNNIFSVGFQ